MSDCTNCGEYCGHSHGQDDMRVILTDLIAELRARHRPDDEVNEGEDPWCEVCATGWDGGDFELIQWPCITAMIADRAEARLREVQGE